MSREGRFQRHATLWRKLLQANSPHRVREALAKDIVGSAQSKEEILEELGCYAGELREAIRSRSLPEDLPARKVLQTLVQIAESRGISSSQFYEVLVERVMFDLPLETGRFTARASTRERILGAALEVFSEKGFHASKMDQVAERAQVAKGTLYRYFENKEALFNDLLRSRLEELDERARNALDSNDDVLTMIAKYLQVYCEFFDGNQKLYRLIGQERLELGVQVQDLYFKQVLRRIHVLRRKVSEAMNQGRLKSFDFQTVFYGFMGFVHGIMQKWLTSHCSYPLMRDLPCILEVLFHGFVVDDKERKSIE